MKKSIEKRSLRLPRISPIPLFKPGAAKRLAEIAKKYNLPSEPSLGQALATIYFNHKDLWLLQKSGPKSERWIRRTSASKELRRSARRLNTATRKFMSALSADSIFAQLLCADFLVIDGRPPPIGDLNTLTRLLHTLSRNSHTASLAKATPGRGKDTLALNVATELGQLYDNFFPLSSRRLLTGMSKSDVRIEFVHDTIGLLGLTLTTDSIRTYRQKKKTSRIGP